MGQKISAVFFGTVFQGINLVLLVFLTVTLAVGAEGFEGDSFQWILIIVSAALIGFVSFITGLLAAILKAHSPDPVKGFYLFCISACVISNLIVYGGGLLLYFCSFFTGKPANGYTQSVISDFMISGLIIIAAIIGTIIIGAIGGFAAGFIFKLFSKNASATK